MTELLVFAASIIATAVAAYNSGLRKFARERWWERKADAYARIIEALAGLTYYHEEHLTAHEEGREIPATLKADIEDNWRRNYTKLKKASAVGAFLISKDAEAALDKMWTDKTKGVDPADWVGQVEAGYFAARECLRSIVAVAKRDLKRDGIWLRPERRRSLGRTGSVALLVGASLLGLLALRGARLWPFSTGTREVAFLQTTFGMSPQEVARTLARYGAQLVTLEEYKSIEPSPNDMFFLDFSMLVFPDERGTSVALYMPGIEMFNAKVEAEFYFLRDRLRSVEVYFHPIVNGQADATVSAVEKTLRGVYSFSNREESKEVPRAYTLNFSSAGARPSFWVNLADRDKPILILTVRDPTLDLEHQRRLQDRQDKAFGR